MDAGAGAASRATTFALSFGLRGALISICAVLGAARGAGQALAPDAMTRPEAPAPGYGTGSDSTTIVTATAFFPEQSNFGYSTSSTLGRYGDLGYGDHNYAGIELPAGVIVDDIGLNNVNDGTDGVMRATLWERHADGSKVALASVASTPHKFWKTDYSAGPLNSTFSSHEGTVLILDVEILPNPPDFEFFGHVQISWHRVVSPGPPVATFTDVATSHPFFKFVEALHAAGITAGYSDGRYGVDDPITRGQTAVFLATALGLHWPD